jgi:DNA-binding transcriptional MocR family regulator
MRFNKYIVTMTIWRPDLSRHGGPKYQAIARAIGEAITEGALKPGDRLPPQRELAWDIGVTVGTVSRAYALAEQHRLVAGEVGRGTYVLDRAVGTGPPSSSGLLPRTDTLVDLSFNETILPGCSAALATTLTEIAALPDVDRLAAYTEPAGHIEHRVAVARWIGRTGLTVDPANVILTVGAQQALITALEVVAGPARCAFAEQLTYSVLKRAAELRDIRLHGLPLDDEGLIPEALDAAARAMPDIRTLFVVPTLQNPTTATMGHARRQAIADVARTHDLTIVEDDIYGYLSTDRPPPLASFAPERTVYLASTSKCTTTGGFRVGWMVAGEPWHGRFVERIYSGTLSRPSLTHEIMRRWIEDGTAEALTRQLRDELALRHAMATEALAGHDYRADPLSPHILLSLTNGWRDDGFVAAMAARGYRLAPSSAFAIGSGYVAPAVRISLGAVRERAVLGTFFGALREQLDCRPATDRMVI